MPDSTQDLTIAAARGAWQDGDTSRTEALCARLVEREPRNAAAWHLLGQARQELGRADRAISCYRRALRIDDTLAEVHNDLGTAYYDKRWYPDAEACFRKAIAHRPDHGVAFANLGAALRAQGKLTDSRRAFQRALLLKLRALLPAWLRWKIAPAAGAARAGAENVASAAAALELKQIANAIRAGRKDEALRMANSLIERFPDDPDAMHMHAVALEEQHDLEGAIARTRAAIERKPDRAEYHLTLARLLVRAFRHNEALAAAAEALRLEPGSAVVMATIAGIYHFWRDEHAVEIGKRALELDPECDLAHGNLASSLWALSRLDEAEHHAREAVRLRPKQLSYRSNLALLLKDQGRMEEARELYRVLAEEAPDYPKVCLDMGTLAVECEGDLEAARRWYRRARASVDYPRAVLCEAIADLLDGRFEAAWPQYEARKQVVDQRLHHSIFAKLPAWNGEPLQGGRLLVYGEQGLGDEIMYASMLADVLARVPSVTLTCDQRLGALFARSFPGVEVIAEPRETLPQRVANFTDISAAIGAGSLGQHFRRRAEDFPRHAGYLKADAAKVAAWRARVESAAPGRCRVGLSWIGGFQRTGRSRRSLSLGQLQPLLATAGTSWISLQHGDCAAEIAAFEAASGLRVHEFPGVTRDLDELAALIGALDLVISVCNTNVHVAGGLGKEALVMAPFVPEWRYGLKGERMIWYPQVRVLRQPAYGVWDPVIAQVSAALKEKLA